MSTRSAVHAPDRCPSTALVDFRTDFHRALTRWADASFELCEAALCLPAPVSSVPSLSLEPVFRRSHGSLYKALARGRLDDEQVRELLVAHRPAHWPLVFAVDASTWPRCDAETSPERGFYYSASTHSAGQPIVAGWSYQWVTQLNWANDSWTAPMDARRIPPTANTVQVTADQVRELVDRLGDTPVTPVFAFDAGYDPIALTHELADVAATLVVRIRDDRVFYTDPAPAPAAARGRPRRHGHRVKLTDPGSWPAPDVRMTSADDRYGTVRVTAWQGLHPRLGRRGHWTGHEQPPIVRGTVIRVEVAAPAQAHQPHQESPVAVGGRPRPRHRDLLARLPTPLRHRTHLPVRQELHGLDRPIGAHPRTGRPMDLADRRRLHPTPPRPRSRERQSTTLGTTGQTRSPDSRPGPTRISATCPHPGHSRQATKIPNPRPGPANRHPTTAQNPLPSGQEDPDRGLKAS